MVIDDEEIVESARTTRPEKEEEKKGNKKKLAIIHHTALLPTLPDYTLFLLLHFSAFVLFQTLFFFFYPASYTSSLNQENS